MGSNSLTVIGTTNRVFAIGTHLDQYGQAISGNIVLRDPTTYQPTHGDSITLGTGTLGTSVNPFQGLHLTSTAKIFKGTSEFQGGGGGAMVEVLEMKSHLEKSGINYPISNPYSINESFTSATNLVASLGQDFSAVSATMWLDWNRSTVDNMSVSGSWTASAGSVSVNSFYQVDGSSIKHGVATLNGTATISRTFTQFSVFNKHLRFRYFNADSTNITKIYATIESSPSQSVTYNFPVTSLTFVNSIATANHCTVDFSVTPDATAGTFVPGAVTKIILGIQTGSSQTVTGYWDDICLVDNVSPELPTKMQISDATNQEILYINSELSTNGVTKGKCTITSPANAYTRAGATIKKRMVNIANNQAGFLSALSGAVAQTSYDITETDISPVADNTLVMSQRFFEEEFPVTALPTTGTVSLYSVTDKKAYFKTGDKVILFKKVWNGRIYTSPRITAWSSKNFLIVTLSGDSTYSGTTIALAHTENNDTGGDSTNLYAVRYSAEMLYRVETLSSNQALLTMTPTIFVPQNYKEMIYDTFDRADTTWGNVGNGWTSLDNGSSGGGWNAGAFMIKSNVLYAGIASGNTGSHHSKLRRDAETYNQNTGYRVSFTQKINQYYGNADALHAFVFGGDALNVSGDVFTQTGVSIGIDTYGSSGTASQLRYIAGGATLATVTIGTITNDTYYDWIIDYYPSGLVEVFYRLTSTGGNYTRLLSYASTVTWTTNYFYIYRRQYTSGSVGAYSYIENFKITTLTGGYIVRGEAKNQSGDRLITATKLTRQDTTNQSPIVIQRSAIISV